MKSAIAVVMLAGCDHVFGVSPPTAFEAPPDSDAAYDRCAPTTFDDPLRYRLLSNPNVETVPDTETVVARPWAWEQARSDCMRHGMDLVVLNEEGELARLEESFVFWIGQKRVAGTWTTVDECPPFTPDSVGREGLECGVVEDALLVSTAACDGTLPPLPDDPSPRLVGHALCETPRAPSPACGARPVDELVFTTSATPLSRAAAIEFCAGQGATLVEIDSHAEWLRATANVDARRYWTNATYDGATWVTQSGCPMLYSWSVPLDTLAAGSCVATSLLEDTSEDATGPEIDGVAPTACDAPDVFALCER